MTNDLLTDDYFTSFAMEKLRCFPFILFVAVVSLASCTFDKTEAVLDTKGYPEDIGKIVLTQCAVPGCHNPFSKNAAGGLSMTTWDELFEGTRDNSSVVPFRTDQSFMMFFINTFPDLGLSLPPQMPFNRSPLPRADVELIKNWIENGAPNSDGFVKFSDNPDTRGKIYIINQGCDLVTVMDRETRLIMRYFDIGSRPGTESPHKSKISPDGKYFYVCFFASSIFQKFSTTDESLVGEVDLGEGSWNTFIITSDSKTAFVVNWSANGSVAVVDMENMRLLTTYQGNNLFIWPHGSVLSDDNTLYVTAQTGNFIYKVDVTDLFNPEISQIVLQPGETPTAVQRYDPHDIHMSPDNSEYAVSCQHSNEVRFFDAATDSLIAVVPTGVFTQEIEFSKSTDYMFVSCMEDNVSFPGKVGSITVIDYKNHTFVKNIYSGYQPHGLEVDDEKKLVYIANRNVNPNGPAPHHSTDCGGRNGYMTIIDMNTMELVPGYKAELSVDPYYISVRD